MLFALLLNLVAQEDDFDLDFDDEPSSASSSKVVNKHGESVLPQAGDMAIGINAVPIMNYFGNMFNGNTANAYSSSFLSGGQTLFAKYFLTEESALRVRFQTSLQTNNFDFYVPDDLAVLADPTSLALKIDNKKVSSSAFGIGAGYEMHRGRGRLRGIFGGEFNFNIVSSKETYTYGNAFSATNTAPSTSDFAGSITNPGSRITERTKTAGSGLGFGLGGFIGVEYFFMPNISLGSELSWGLQYNIASASDRTDESWSGTAVNTVNNSISPKSGNLNLGMTNPAATLYLMFHF